MNRFALIGAAGYVAPRHMQAIHQVGGALVAALDPSDSVGIIDRYFPDAAFFTAFERFDRHLEKLKRSGKGIDYLTICSPNYLHDAHIRFGLRHGANVICEKPLVLNPWNVDALQEIEAETDKKVNCILQLRLHPSVVELKRKMDAAPADKVWDVDLTYLTSRGNWYYASWKGEMEKSGGIATNIGIHFFDMLQWLFGDVEASQLHLHTHDRAAGVLQLQRARVRWFLGINYDLIPADLRAQGRRTYRALTIDEEAVEFSDGFNDLHDLSYAQIMAGNGFGLAEATKAVKITHDIRNKQPVGPDSDSHPMAHLPLAKHPFKR